MTAARVVVPIVIAVVVLHLTGTLPLPQPPRPATPSPGAVLTVPDGPWFPVAVGITWVYDAEGTYQARREGGTEQRSSTMTRSVLRQRSDGSFQVTESVDDRVLDNSFVRLTARGVELESMGLDKRVSLFLPADFGPGATWRLTDTWRATADEEPEELEVAGYGTLPCIRVRYERFYDEKQTPRPDWFFDGYRWFHTGLGPVKEDFRDIQRPRENGSVEILDTWEVRELRTFTRP